MEQANVTLNLQTQDSHLRLARLALDSATVRESWAALPADVRQAHNELFRLTQEQTRLGHLRSQERQSVELHMGYVNQHRDRVRTQAEELRQTMEAHDRIGDFRRSVNAGTIEKDAKADPALAHLQAMDVEARHYERQSQAIDQTQQVFGRYGLSPEFNMGNAAGYYGKRALFGTNQDGSPRTAREWATKGAAESFGKMRNTARQAAAIFGAFEGISLITNSMRAFEERAEVVQRLGTSMGTNFEDVGRELGTLRDRFRYTRSEMVPALQELAHHMGSTKDAADVLYMARVTGMDPAAVASAAAKAHPYGGMDFDLVQRMTNFAGMGSRRQMAVQMWSAAQGTLGPGYYETPDDAAARYVALTSRAMGEPYQSERGADFVQRLISGVRAPGSQMMHALKLNAVRGLKVPGLDMDTNSYRGMRAALETGSPEVLEALFRMSTQQGGTGEIGAEFFQQATGLSTIESDRLFRDMQKGGGRMPTGAAIRKAPDMSDTWKQVTDETMNPAWRSAGIKTGMESVHEEVGQYVVPIAQDFRQAMMSFLEGLTRNGDILNGLRNALERVTFSDQPQASPATPWLFNSMIALNSDSLMGYAVRLLGVQAGKHAANVREIWDFYKAKP